MKKMISLIMAIVMALPLLTVNANATQGFTDYPYTVTYENAIPGEDCLDAFRQHILAQLEELGVDPSECAISFGTDGDIMPLNDIADYKTEYTGWKTVTVKTYPENQAPKGTMFPTGGGFYASEDGGPVVSVALNFPGFPAPFQGHSLSVCVGMVSNSGGLIAYAPRPDVYYKCVIEKDYLVNVYVIYHRAWSEAKWDYVWEEWSGGMYEEFQTARAYAEPVT